MENKAQPEQKGFWELPENLEQFNGFQEFKIGCHIPKAKEIAEEAMQRGNVRGRFEQAVLMIKSLQKMARAFDAQYAEQPEERTAALGAVAVVSEMLEADIKHLTELLKQYGMYDAQ